MLLINYVSFFPEIFYSIGFFILFTWSFFFGLSKNSLYPSVYTGASALIVLLSIGFLLLDFSLIESTFLTSYDFIKQGSDFSIRLILIVSIICFILYSADNLQRINLAHYEFIILVYISALSLLLFISSKDIISFYLLLEIQSIAFYILTAFRRQSQYSVESGLKYFVLSSFSSIILLFGFAFLYGITGFSNFIDISLFISAINFDSTLLFSIMVPTVLIFTAILFKLYAAPFHLWVSDIYQGANTASTAFFATVTPLPLFYVFIKLYIDLFQFITPNFNNIILFVSILSMFLGMIGAINQKKIKRVVAFSSVTTIGYVLVGLVNENPNALTSSFFYFINYAITLVGIFILFLNLRMSKLNIYLERLTLLAGLYQKNMIFSISLILLFFASAGIPPFSLFIAKAGILINLSYSIHTKLLYLLIITAIISGFFYIRITKYIAFDNNTKWYPLGIMCYSNSFLLFIILFFITVTTFNTSLLYTYVEHIGITTYI